MPPRKHSLLWPVSAAVCAFPFLLMASSWFFEKIPWSPGAALFVSFLAGVAGSLATFNIVDNVLYDMHYPEDQ